MTNTPFDIKKIEKNYNAKYIGDFPVKLAAGGWGSAGAVFYQANPDVSKGHKNLFGFYYNALSDTAVIYDASYLEDTRFMGAILDDGGYAWSTHRHDMRQVPNGYLDGGFNYVRVIGDVKTTLLTIKDGKVVEVKEND